MSTSVASRMSFLRKSASSAVVLKQQLRHVTTISGSWTIPPQSQPLQPQKRHLAAAPSSDGTRKRDKQLEIALATLNAPIHKEPPVDADEQKRRYDIGRNYNIGRVNRHNELHHDLACKLKLKNHAIRMLPKHSKIKEEALKIDAEGPPLWRDIMADTPPIPGFDPNVFLEGEDV
eukprot:CAMPEP_0195255038 /NCGR_PEP_ID=MMETSP0706-20130129/5403_1 /TAXON_ID=33640 /ORGANISM="Asterionellopsis glacialis, Strain CCMP134" /LENGTH=174 /DNA_ID=CAMNT_0040307815 /DNA_START=28 /DNA_END=552 /DNA_ORIENTATION=+